MRKNDTEITPFKGKKKPLIRTFIPFLAPYKTKQNKENKAMPPHRVWKGLEVKGGGGHGLGFAILCVGSVVAMSEMPTARQVEAHHTIERAKQCSIDSKVCGRARVWLHVDPPLCGVELECTQGTLAAERFDLWRRKGAGQD